MSCRGCEVLKKQPTPATWDTQDHSYYDSHTSVNLSTAGMKGVEMEEEERERAEMDTNKSGEAKTWQD